MAKALVDTYFTFVCWKIVEFEVKYQVVNKLNLFRNNLHDSKLSK